MWWIVVMTVAAVLGYAVWTFNRLVGLSKRADAAWSDIDVQLKRQVGPGSRPGRDGQGICSSRVEHARACRGGAGQAVQPASIAERGTREQNLSAAVGRLFAVAEAYPDLKATQNFQDLQRNLVEIENNIQYARRYYNAVVRDWNTLVESIPSALGRGGGRIPRTAVFPARRRRARGAPGRVRFVVGPWHASRKRRRAARASRIETGEREAVVPRSHSIHTAIPGLDLPVRRDRGQRMGLASPLGADSGWTVQHVRRHARRAARRGARRDRVDRRQLRSSQTRHLPRDPDPIRGRDAAICLAVSVARRRRRRRPELSDRGVVRGESGSDPDRRRGSDARRSRPISHPLPRASGRSSGKGRAPGVEKKGIAITPSSAGTPREPSGACPSRSPR